MKDKNSIIDSKVDDTNYSILVKQEIANINAFKDAHGLLVSQYGNLIDKLYEYAPVIIVIGDISSTDSPHVYINKYAEKELGHSVHDMILGGTKFIQSSFHPHEMKDTLKKNMEFFQKLYTLPPEETDKLVMEQVKRIKHKNGHYIWFNVRTTLLSRKSDGTPHLVLTIMSNVNDSIELQEQKQKTLNLEIKLLKEKVKSQNEQLQMHLLSSIDNDKCYDDVAKYIKSISENLTEEEQIPFNQVINYINRNKPNVNVWEEFLERFQDINPNFIKLLSTKYPSLTPTELKICSLTRTGLNSKDISSILKISIRSVENHKYNIRRKFDLEPYQNLYNHINAIA
jgi:DNA-binding CsgD family transcriptional regulator